MLKSGTVSLGCLRIVGCEVRSHQGLCHNLEGPQRHCQSGEAPADRLVPTVESIA